MRTVNFGWTDYDGDDCDDDIGLIWIDKDIFKGCGSLSEESREAIESIYEMFDYDELEDAPLFLTKIEELLNSQHFSKEKSLYGSWFTMEALDGK